MLSGLTLSPRMLDPHTSYGCSPRLPRNVEARNLRTDASAILRECNRDTGATMDLSATACAVYPLQASYSRQWGTDALCREEVGPTVILPRPAQRVGRPVPLRRCQHCIECYAGRQRLRGMHPIRCVVRVAPGGVSPPKSGPLVRWPRCLARTGRVCRQNSGCMIYCSTILINGNPFAGMLILRAGRAVSTLRRSTSR